MLRPWQIWLVYLLCLALALPALGWLSWRAVELDSAEAAARSAAEQARRAAVTAAGQAELARLQADLQERISSALWRMDWALTPLIAQEAARPYFVYRPFFENLAEGAPAADRPVPSPLLMQPSPYVLLYFQLRPSDEFSSPQCPTGPQNLAALACGVPPERIDRSADQLAALRGRVNYERLLALLPEQPLTIPVNDLVWSGRFEGGGEWENSASQQLDPTQQQPYVVTNNLAYPNSSPFEEEAQQQALVAPRGGESPPRANEPPRPAAEPTRNEQRDNLPVSLDQPPRQTPPLPQVAGQQAAGQQVAGQPAVGQGGQSRGGYEYWQRNRALQSYAQGKVVEQRAMLSNDAAPVSLVTEGVSRPLWVGDDLLLARRVLVQDQVLIQGCWLDWPRLEELLRAEVADLLPEVEFVAVRGEEPVPSGRSLATVPVRLEVPEPVLTAAAAVPEGSELPRGISPVRLTLPFAWGGLLLAAVAVAVLLRGVVALSERRGAFVSAVTHELRTPLTTFRMYAEMLAEEMVPDPAARRHYLQTLRSEADRLSHLVENVLAYARLERGASGSRRREVALAELIERAQTRLQARAGEIGWKVRVRGLEEAGELLVSTDAAAVEQILFNLVDNACKYAHPAAEGVIDLELIAAPRPALRVRDYGPGIAEPVRRRLFRPFSKSVREAADSAPGVGLGLALCRRLARQLGGDLQWEPGAAGCSFLLTLPRA